MSAAATHFRLSGVSLRFATAEALSGVELSIGAGEALALVGPSGAGKTTLLRCLNGSARPSRGSVEAGGRKLASLSRRELRALRASIGFVQQDLGLVPSLRVAQNVLAGRVGRQRLLGSLASLLRPSRSQLADVHRLLERVGIEEKLFERTDRLSGGQQQRVAIARALYQRPSALIADEPVSSVDPARARDTLELLTRLSREEQLTLCVSLHSTELARELFPRLVGLRGGRIVFDRPSTEVDQSELAALYALEPAGARRDGG